MRNISRGRKDGIFYQLHYFSSFHFSLGFVLSSIEKKRGNPFGIQLLSVPSLTENGEAN